MRNVRQNLLCSFLYNGLGVPVAAGVLYPFGTAPSRIWLRRRKLMRAKQLGMNFGLAVLLASAVAGGVYLGLAVDRFARGQDRALAQELVIHHFERSSWFALNAGNYEELDPALARGFREAAAWHARRAREYQRMDPAVVARESERDTARDLSDGRLMERALRHDAARGKQRETPRR